MSAEPQVIYGPRRGLRWLWCLLMLGAGILLAVVQWPAGLHGNPMALLSTLVLLLAGLATLLGIVRDAPRLTLDHHGIVLRTLLRTKSVPWECLGPFTVRVVGLVRGRQVFKATAPVTAPSGGTFSVPDAFDAPFALVVRALAEWHGGLATGVAPVTQGPAVAAPEVGVAGFRWPWLTIALLASFIAVFIIEQRFAVAPGGPAMSPALATLTALGGLHRTLVAAGQWYRLLTAPFLHSGLSHLVFNGVAFVLAGYALERYVGRAWTLCIFAAGALAGSAASLMFLGPATVSVGASGAIMAMLVSLFLISFRLPAGRMKAQIQAQSARIAIPALIPAGAAVGAMHIDYGAHFGGALLGAAVGLVLLRTWREAAPLPRFRTGAALFAVLAALAIGASAVAVALRYPTFVTPPGMIPLAEFPHSTAEMVGKADGLLAAYPRDPRSHAFAGAAKALRGDIAGAEQDFRTSLSLGAATQAAFPPAFANYVRATLALTLLAEKRGAEARDMAREPCAATGAAATPAQAMALLKQTTLCAEPATPLRP